MADSGNVARLARQFREDVRASSTAKAAAAGLELTSGDGPAIAYRVEGSGLIREETLAGAVRRREGYTMDRLGPLDFEVKGSRVRLLLARRSARASRWHGPPSTSTRVSARIARWPT